MAKRVCVVEHKFADEFDVKYDSSDSLQFLEEVAVAVLKVFQSRGINIGRVFRRVPGATLRNDSPIVLGGDPRGFT